MSGRRKVITNSEWMMTQAYKELGLKCFPNSYPKDKPKHMERPSGLRTITL